MLPECAESSARSARPRGGVGSVRGRTPPHRAPGGPGSPEPGQPRGPPAGQTGDDGPPRRQPRSRGVAAVGPQVLARAGVPHRRGRRRDVHRGRPDGPDGRGPARARRGAGRDDCARDDPGVRPHDRPARGLADPAHGRGPGRPRPRGRPRRGRCQGCARPRRRQCRGAQAHRHGRLARAAAHLRLAPPPHGCDLAHARRRRPAAVLAGRTPRGRVRRPGQLHLPRAPDDRTAARGHGAAVRGARHRHRDRPRRPGHQDGGRRDPLRDHRRRARCRGRPRPRRDHGRGRPAARRAGRYGGGSGPLAAR